MQYSLKFNSNIQLITTVRNQPLTANIFSCLFTFVSADAWGRLFEARFKLWIVSQ